MTGEPDYSHQWIQYYRALKMDEQASLVEFKMKERYEKLHAEMPPPPLIPYFVPTMMGPPPPLMMGLPSMGPPPPLMSLGRSRK